MDVVSRGWRWRCGLGTLLAAFALTGAWIKSVVDHVVIRDAVENQAYSLPLSGKIGIFVTTNPIEWSGFVPETQWSVTGLYADADITIAPEQVHARLPDPVPPAELQPKVSQSSVDALVQASFSDESDLANGLLIQTAASQLSAGPGSLQSLQEGLSTTADFKLSGISDASLPDDAWDSDDTDDNEGRITAQWQCCGFQFERQEYVHSGDGTFFLIPHWSLVLPLWLVTIALLVRLRRGDVKHSATVVNPEPVAAGVTGAETGEGVGSFFGGWRRKWGVATLLVSLTLVGGWVRSSVVSDLIILDSTQSQFRLVSSKEGLVFDHNCTTLSDNSRIRYRTLTGRAHDQLTFFPMGFNSTAFNSPVEQGSFELAEESVLPSFENAPAELPRFAEIAMVADEPEPLMPSPTAVNLVAAVRSDAHAWAGRYLAWSGLFISCGSNGTRVVVPYGLVTIPLTLLSAILLIWPNASRAKCRTVGGSTSEVLP
ncbi:MAG: hypothetical protein NTZ32_21100 [Planctomycetales bacterium]|nr:hypothetical protein [Planctomycetales bacterium]